MLYMSQNAAYLALLPHIKSAWRGILRKLHIQKKRSRAPPPLPSLPGRALLLPAAPQQSQRGAGVMVMLCGMLCGDTCGKSWAWRSGDGVRESEGRGALESRGKRAGGGMACGVSLLRFRASSDSVRRGRLLVPALLLLPVINGFLQA